MFDIQVQHRDTKTGRVKEENPYRLHVVSGKSYYERPQGSGNLWSANGEPAGQIAWENEGKKKVIKEGVAHREYSRPLTINEQMQREFESRGTKVIDLEAKVAELEAAAIAAEAIDEMDKIESEAKPAVVAKPAAKGK